jgi:hypothetical protein
MTTSSGTGGSTGTALQDADVPDGLAACTKFSAQAQQAPAAMLIVLQRSASMAGTTGKWPAAQQAIVQAIDEDVFDTMSLGLSAFPVGTTPAPACLGGIYPTVYCSYPGYVPTPSTSCMNNTQCTPPASECSSLGVCRIPLPVPVAPAGTQKSNAPTGVRHQIASWLSTNNPESDDPSNSSPIYDAMNYGYQVLQGTTIDKRIMVLITDGGFDCTSVSKPLRAGISDGLCFDWEYPTTVNKLITDARTNAAAPVETFIVGVPGSNTMPNEVQGAWTAAPYYMLLALSTYAVSGSPSTVDPNCDKNAVWSQNGPPPAHPCHIDLSSSNFNAAALAAAITTIRGKALGCVYDLPPAPMGQTIDPNKVNVVVTINGMAYTIPKRTNPSDMCLVNPCWDYDMNGKVNLIGITCSTVASSPNAKVDIYVGCATITQ